MFKLKLSTLLIITAFLFSCANDQSSETETSSELAPDTYTEAPVNASETSEAEVSASRQRNEIVTTEDKKYNDDGSVTITKIITDGVEVKRSEETIFPNSNLEPIVTTSKNYVTSNFDEAYNYSRRAYLNFEDIETANGYLKKAMSYFEAAESDADDADCDDAKSSASYGYSYAKKGYNETDTSEIERFAKKAMNEAENGKSAMDDCKSTD